MYIQVNNTILCLVAAYKKPNNILLPAEFNLLLDSQHNIIIAGDLNCKHHGLAVGCRCNMAGNVLVRHLNSRNDLFVATLNIPNHYLNNLDHSPVILDIAIIKGNNIRFHFKNLFSDLSSDHIPLVLELKSTTKHINPPISSQTTE